MELSEEQLGLRYQSFCDPRLNFEQSLGTLLVSHILFVAEPSPHQMSPS